MTALIDDVARLLAWPTVICGALAMLAGVVLLTWLICDLAYRRGRAAWGFVWFVAWRAHRRHEDPTLAKMLDAAIARAEQAECRILRAAHEEAKECWKAVATFEEEHLEEMSTAQRLRFGTALTAIADRIRAYERAEKETRP